MATTAGLPSKVNYEHCFHAFEILQESETTTIKALPSELMQSLLIYWSVRFVPIHNFIKDQFMQSEQLIKL